MGKIVNFFRRPFWSDYRVLFGVWTLIGIISALLKMHHCNNFLVYSGTFWHTIEQLPLYAEYPMEYSDVNHYGPIFGLLIAPFAACPLWLGLLLWNVALAVGLWWALRTMPMDKRGRIFVYWFTANELFTALAMQQFNVATVALICASFCCIERGCDFWSALFIALGTFVKIYGIVGLAFFFFSRHKTRLVLSLLFWSAVLFVLPMLISSPEYVINQYGAWAADILEKNGNNAFSTHQNISLLGMVRKISGVATYSDLWLMLPGMLLFCLPYLRIAQWRNVDFRYAFLASVLMFVVLFSSGSESSSYIIALVGASFWYCMVPWQRSKVDVALMVFAFVLTSLSPTDIIPPYVRNEIVRPYALKALPIALIWFKLIYEMLTRDYGNKAIH